MGERMNEASLRLDECLLRFMDQVELLEEKRERLNSLIEQGWFSISKARYSMGNKRVSTLQYGSEIEPQVRVNARVLESGGAEFDAVRREYSEKDPLQVEDVGPKEEGLRRRGVAKQDDPVEEAAPQTHVSKETAPSNQGSSHHQDPLRWFGILVPQSLRQAQASFKKVIELSAEVASLQSAVLATRKELRALMGIRQEGDSAHSGKTRHAEIRPGEEIASDA